MIVSVQSNNLTEQNRTKPWSNYPPAIKHGLDNPQRLSHISRWLGNSIRSSERLPINNREYLGNMGIPSSESLPPNHSFGGFAATCDDTGGYPAGWKPLDLIEDGRIWLLIHKQFHLTSEDIQLLLFTIYINTHNPSFHKLCSPFMSN